ncbi:MAG: hypothetical protein IPM34_14830 [Saprospiraceae bacterium]|nr:hypothetical protein [Saprospiraceae bacterium]
MNSIKDLYPLIGKWKIQGDDVTGEQEMKILDGNYFLFQQFDIIYSGRHINGIEIYEFDEGLQLCVKNLYDNEGHHFTYYIDIVEYDIIIWFQEVHSENSFKGKFSEDFLSYAGAWTWSGGGYSLKAIKS